MPDKKSLIFAANFKPPKFNSMKKLLAIIVAASIMVSCNDASKTETTVSNDSLTIEANKIADSVNSIMDIKTDSANKMKDTNSKMMNNIADTAK